MGSACWGEVARLDGGCICPGHLLVLASETVFSPVKWAPGPLSLQVVLGPNGMMRVKPGAGVRTRTLFAGAGPSCRSRHSSTVALGFSAEREGWGLSRQDGGHHPKGLSPQEPTWGAGPCPCFPGGPPATPSCLPGEPAGSRASKGRVPGSPRGPLRGRDAVILALPFACTVQTAGPEGRPGTEQHRHGACMPDPGFRGSSPELPLKDPLGPSARDSLIWGMSIQCLPEGRCGCGPWLGPPVTELTCWGGVGVTQSSDLSGRQPQVAGCALSLSPEMPGGGALLSPLDRWRN